MSFDQKKYTWTHDLSALDDKSHLVMGLIHRDKEHEVPLDTFDQNFQWQHLAHQCGGILCQHIFMTACILPMTGSATQIAHEAHKKYYDQSIALGNQALHDLIEYHEILKKQDVDCNRSYFHFAEGLYPIDFTRDFLYKMSGIEMPTDWAPKDLQNDTKQRSLFSYWRDNHDWFLGIFGPNSD